MAFGTVDDKLWRHQKFTEAGLAATGVCVKSWSWSNDHGTNGFTSDAVAKMLSEGDKRIPGVLVRVRLWDRVEGGYMIHGFTKHGRNRSAEWWAERRRAKQAAGQLGGLASVESGAAAKNLESALASKQVLGEISKQPSKQVLGENVQADQARNPVTPLTPGPFADAKAPYPRADAREAEAATRSQDDEGTASVVGGSNDVDGTAGGAVQPVGKLAEHLMDGRARKAGSAS